jgi:hypothetical protein
VVHTQIIHQAVFICNDMLQNIFNCTKLYTRQPKSGRRNTGELMNKGLETGHAMAELAADRAGFDWKLLALEAVRQHALKKRYFTTEQVRGANPDLPEPPDKRAWGAIARLAKKEGQIRAETRSMEWL